MSHVRRGVASGNACGPPLGDRRADRLGASRTPRSAAGDPGVPAWLLEGVSEEICVPFKLLSWHDDKKPDMSQTFSKKCFTGCMAFDILFLAPKSAAVRAVSSGVEHYLDTVGVTSSNLVSPTTNSTGHREVPVACFAISRRCEAQALGGPFLGIHTERGVRCDAFSEVGIAGRGAPILSWGREARQGSAERAALRAPAIFATARRGPAARRLVSETADAPRFDALIPMRHRRGARCWIRATAGRRAPARSMPVWLERPAWNRARLRRSARCR